MLDIHFADRKYGRELLVDAAAVQRLPGFISDQRPHRLLFYDITFVTAGRGHLHLDAEDHRVTSHRVLFTAAGQIRAWTLTQPLRGYALFFRPEFFLEFLAAPRFPQSIPGFREGSPQGVTLERHSFDALVRQVQEVMREIQEGRPESDALVHGTVYRLLLDLRRRLPKAASQPAPGPRLSHAIVDRYLHLLDREPRANRSVRESAAALGVTPGYLNRLTRRHLGLEATRVAHDRLMLEAKRLLRYTDLAVGQIASRLGFSDPAYFARFFRAHSGEAPRTYRRRAT